MKLPLPWDQLDHNMNLPEVEHLMTQITQSIKSSQHELKGSKLKHNQGGDWKLSNFFERSQKGEREWNQEFTMRLGGRCVELGEGDENCNFIDIWNRYGGFGEQHIVYPLLSI
jgi:hypothetical protein